MVNTGGAFVDSGMERERIISNVHHIYSYNGQISDGVDHSSVDMANITISSKSILKERLA